MNYEDFKNEVVENIKEHLPEKYSDAVVSINEIQKNNVTLDGLTIRTEDLNVTPTIYLDNFFADVNNGNKSMDQTLDEIAAIYEENLPAHDFDISQISEFEAIKEKIVPRLVGVENNDAFLMTRPHEVVADDLAVTYHISLSGSEHGEASIPITDGLLAKYGITQDELHETAMINLSEMMNFTFKGMNEVMAEMMMPQILEATGGDVDAAKEMIASMVPGEDAMFVVTNESKLNGAVAIIDEKTMDDIAEKVGGDFFVLPSSVHECIVVPVSEDGPNRKDLEQMVVEVNANEVSAQDKLSDHVYAYDSKEHELLRGDVYEERIANKEQTKVSFKEQLETAKSEVRNNTEKTAKIKTKENEL